MQAARKHSDSHAIRYKLHRFPSSNMRTPNLIIVTFSHTMHKSTLFRVICQLLSILFVSLLEDRQTELPECYDAFRHQRTDSRKQDNHT